MRPVLHVLFVFLVVSAVPAEHGFAAKAKPSVILDYIPADVKPGDKPFTLEKDLIQKLLPALKNPRLMELSDIVDPHDQNAMLEEGYSFVLRGDFNQDGLADVAFVGKYDNVDDPYKNVFVAIFSVKGKSVYADCYLPIPQTSASLLAVPNYKRKLKAIRLNYEADTEDCAFLYWAGRNWKYESCPTEYH